MENKDYIPVNIILTMAGKSTRFKKAGWNIPKWRLEIRSLPDQHFLFTTNSMLSCALETYALCDFNTTFTFVVDRDAEEHKQEDKKIFINKTFRDFQRKNPQLNSDFNIVVVDKILGQADTAYRGIKQMVEHLEMYEFNPRSPIVIGNIDTCVLDGRIASATSHISDDRFWWTFESSSEQFGYLLFDENKNVIGCKEKQVVSHEASLGIFAYRDYRLFMKDFETNHQKVLDQGKEISVPDIQGWDGTFGYQRIDIVHPKDKSPVVFNLGTPAEINKSGFQIVTPKEVSND